MLASKPARGVRSTAVAAFEAQRTALIQSVEPLGLFTVLDVQDRLSGRQTQLAIGEAFESALARVENRCRIDTSTTWRHDWKR